MIRDNNDINQKDGITLFNSTISENWVHANIIMSRAIFNYLDDKKDEIMKMLIKKVKRAQIIF